MSTVAIPGFIVAERLSEVFPDVVIEADDHAVTVPGERVVEVALFLRDDPELDCKFLNTLLGVDWLDHFDVVYQMSSLARNHTLVLKARISHDRPIIDTVNGVWLAANLQEREVYDLMGITFLNHPNLTRIFLWDGFPGHPLRKDFLALPAGHKPGLQRFPYEFSPGQRNYPSLQNTQSPTAPSVPELVAPAPLSGLPGSGGQLGTMGGGARGARIREELAPPVQGAGNNPALAGGTDPEPEDSAERGHAGPGAGAGEEGRSGEQL